MDKFEVGIAFRGTTAPEVRQVVEASSMREAMLNMIDHYGGNDVVLVTHAQYFQNPEPLPPRAEYGLAASPAVIPFLLAQ